MTEPYQPEQPQSPYQPGGPVSPPQQYQPHPAGPQDPGSAQPGHLPAPPAGSSTRKPLLLAAVAFVALLMFAATGVTVYEAFIKEDSGLAACRALAGGKDPDGTVNRSGDMKLTEAEYRQTRKLFEDSRYEDIRKHGTALMDIAWQISQLPKGQELGAFAFLASAETATTGLESACADQGVDVNLKNR
ncbi:hypothetical protein AB0B85_10515 [Micromonospora sp. NPDC049044]|uniref:hypothetical protein n=1 Tax=Micromonospora sp. NPDC049044 TaxID=3154827 RepID=UPI003405ED82